MRLTWPPKDPTEILDYSVDWSNRLANDHLITSTFIINGGANVSIIANSFNDSMSTVWLAGGTTGRVAIITNHVQTAGGREWEESVHISIEDK